MGIVGATQVNTLLMGDTVYLEATSTLNWLYKALAKSLRDGRVAEADEIQFIIDNIEMCAEETRRGV